MRWSWYMSDLRRRVVLPNVGSGPRKEDWNDADEVCEAREGGAMLRGELSPAPPPDRWIQLLEKMLRGPRG